MAGRLPGTLSVLLVGCLPAVAPPNISRGSGDADSDLGTTTLPSATAAPTVTTTAPGMTSPGTSTGSGASSSGGMAFVEIDDAPGVRNCSLFDQDCAPGEKCNPFASDGGPVWNALQCFPVVEDPDDIGEPCTVEDSPTSGLDTCDVGQMCWNVHPETLAGSCIAFCIGSKKNATCEQACATCSIAGDGVLALCLAGCDPINQDCPDGEGCYAVDSGFTCAPVAGDLPSGEPCDSINTCQPGNMCATADTVPACAGGLGCCTPFCQVGDDAPCVGLPGTQCVEISPDDTDGCITPGVGACLIPL